MASSHLLLFIIAGHVTHVNKVTITRVTRYQRRLVTTCSHSIVLILLGDPSNLSFLLLILLGLERLHFDNFSLVLLTILLIHLVNIMIT